MLFLLLLGLVAGQGLNVTFQCQSATDLYSLLFGICNQCALCQGLYQIDPYDPSQEAELRKFSAQVSLLEFFLVNNGSANVTDWLHPFDRTQDELRFLASIWPPAWQPNFVVSFDPSGESCAATFNLTSDANLATIYVLLDLLKTYRAYIAIEAFCGDPNERLIFERHSGTFYCLCAAGKSCVGNAGRFQSLVELLMCALLVFILLLIFFVVVVGVRFFRALPGERASLLQ